MRVWSVELTGGVAPVVSAFSQSKRDNANDEIDCQNFCDKIEQLVEREHSKGTSILATFNHRLLSSGKTAVELFSQLDTDGTGDLDMNEFHAALTSVGLKVTLEAAGRAMAELDRDGDGTINCAELIRGLSEFQRKRRVFANGVLERVLQYVSRTNTSMARTFSKVDADGSGLLDVLELQYNHPSL